MKPPITESQYLLIAGTITAITFYILVKDFYEEYKKKQNEKKINEINKGWLY
jgi:ribosome biogenesis protein Tsr3